MRTEKHTKILIGSIFLFLLYTVPVYAGNLEGSKLVTGTSQLIADGTKILTGFIAGLTGYVTVKDIIQWIMADDEEKTKAKKRLQRDVCIGVLGTVGVGLIAIIFAYYQ